MTDDFFFFILSLKVHKLESRNIPCGKKLIIMLSVLSRNEHNIGRQYQLDLLKALSIVSMILCHTVMRLAVNRSGYETEAGYLFGDAILGCYVGVAHAFMFAMGVGFVFSKKNTSGDLLRRGIYIYLLGYVLDFFRFGIYAILDGALKVHYSPDFFHAIFFQDIFQFAGLAMMLTALLRRLQLNEVVILAIGVLLSCIGSVVPDLQTGNAACDLFLGSFLTATQVPSHFTLFHWYVFVAAGMFFAQIIRRILNEELFYKRLLLISGVLMTIFILSTVKYGMFFLNLFHRYYSVSILEAVGYLSIDFFLLSLFYLIVNGLGTERMGVFLTMSRNITSIYVIHWCILGLIDFVLCYCLQFVLSYPVIYFIGICLVVVSYYLAVLWGNRTD